MIDISSEALVSLPEAAKFLPGNPHISTLHRWVAQGIRGVRLETCLVGGRRFTSREKLQLFAQAVTIAADDAEVLSATNQEHDQSSKEQVDCDS